MARADEAPLANPLGNTPEYSVSELAHALKRTVEDAYAYVRVRGELSGCKRAASGHLYLCLKDEGAVLDGCMWRQAAAGLTFKPEDGLDVVATGRLSTYPGRSKYQLIIERLEVAGEGALLAQIARRKATLAAEGLFAQERKRALPFLPRVIGVVTSPTGAVIRDILHRLADRFPRDVILWPVQVQGPTAAAQVAAAVRGLNALPPDGPIPRPDLLIVARGGGSIEDLMAFNEEEVVRAVAESAIPTIAAVGHETDTTLVDLAADRRAPTPTAAAELAVPVRAELALSVADLALRSDRALAREQRTRRERVLATGCRLPAPRELMGLAAQRVDDLGERLPLGLARASERTGARLARYAAALAPALLARHSERAGRALADAERALVGAASTAAATAARRLERAAAPLRPALLTGRRRVAEAALTREARLLDTLSPLATLARGYAVVEREEGGVLTTAVEAARAGRVGLRFHDGRVAARIEAPKPSKPRRRAPTQERLL